MAALAQGLQGALVSPYALQNNPNAVQLLRRTEESRRAHKLSPTFIRSALQNSAQVARSVQTSNAKDVEPLTGGLQPADATAEEAGAIDQHSTAPAYVEPHIQDVTRSLAEEDRRKLWMAAIKPPMYSVGFMPVLVAAACVYQSHGVVPWASTAGFVLAAILIIGWLNLSNDAFDAQTGVDTSKPESVVNLLGGGPGRRTAVLLLAKALLVAGVALLAHLITGAPTGDLRPAGLLAFSIACGYIYQGPPFRLSYKGLGEPLCFAAFGPSATTAFYLALQPAGATAGGAVPGVAGGATGLLSLAADVPAVVWSCSVLVGLTTTVILFCSHFHQIAGDTAAGKRSPLVRLGTERGCRVLRAAVIAGHVAVVSAAAGGMLPWPAAAATMLAALAGRETVAFADEHHTVPQWVAPLKRFAVKWHVAYGFSLCLGLVAARMVGL